MGNNCVTKKKENAFKGVKNSVYLTKEKTMAKDLKKINEEYKQNINLGESTNQLNSNHPAIEQPPRLSNFIGVPNSFPEFKRNEYDEGGVRKNFIYFNQVKSNFTKILGKTYIDLIDKNNIDEQELLAEILRVSLGDNVFTFEEYNKKFLATNNLLKEKAEYHPFNASGIANILKSLLEREGITLFYEEVEEDKVVKSSSPILSTCLTPYNIHLTSSSFIDEYLLISLKETETINFNDLSAQKHLRENFLEKIESLFFLSFEKRNISQTSRKLFFLRIVHEEKENYKEIKLAVFLPQIDMKQLDKLILSLNEILKENFEQYLTIERLNILKHMHIKSDDFDSWGNKEFKETTFLGENQINFLTKGGLPYYKPPNGWKRLGFNVTKEFSDLSWLLREENKNEQKFEWANCYINISSYLLNRSFNLRTKICNEFDFYQSLSQSLDIGPNKDIFEDKTCGRGVIVSEKVTNFLLDDDQLLNMINLEFVACPIEIISENIKRYYFVLLQCRVNPKKVRIPQIYGGRYWIVNEGKDVRPYGLLIKEGSAREVGRYFEAEKP